MTSRPRIADGPGGNRRQDDRQRREHGVLHEHQQKSRRKLGKRARRIAAAQWKQAQPEGQHVQQQHAGDEVRRGAQHHQRRKQVLGEPGLRGPRQRGAEDRADRPGQHRGRAQQRNGPRQRVRRSDRRRGSDSSTSNNSDRGGPGWRGRRCTAPRAADPAETGCPGSPRGRETSGVAMRGRMKLTVSAIHTTSTNVPHRRVMYPRLTFPTLAASDPRSAGRGS